GVSRMSPASRLASAVLCSSLFALPALAQSAPPDPATQPCRADVARLCPDAKGRQAVRACMKEKTDQVAADGKAKWADFKQRAAAAIEAFAPDVQKFCPDVKPGHGRVMVCLKQHQNELSDACRAQRPPRPAAPQ